MKPRSIIVAVAFVACTDNSTAPPTDNEPPPFAVRHVREGDMDGDGLIDLEIAWSRVDGVDISKTLIKALDGDSANRGNLLAGWRTVASDSGMVVHETLDHLLPYATTKLLIQISDSAGNVAADTVDLELPAGKLIKTLATARSGTTSDRAFDIAICDGVGYMPAGPYMVVFDPDSLKILAEVRNPETLSELEHVVCTEDGLAYVTQPLHRFDRTTHVWNRVPGTFGANAIVQSVARPNLLYIGERGGNIALFDRTTQQRIGRLTEKSAIADEYVFAIAVTPGDEKLYFSRTWEGGVMVVNPHTGATIARIHLGGNSHYGATHDMVMSQDGKRLFIAIRDGLPRGVAFVDTNTDVIQHLIDLHEYVPQGIGLSPSEKRLFLTTLDRDPAFPSENVLIDVASRRVLQRFARPRIVGGRFDNRIAFHPHGKLFFVVRNLEIDVYLNRE